MAPRCTAPASLSQLRGPLNEYDSSTAQNPSHTYAAAGTYTVTLTVTDDDGASGSANTSVTVTAAPQPPAAPTNLVSTVHSTGKGKKRVITGIELNWNDNSNTESAFEIERCEQTGKGKNKSCPWAKVAETGTDVNTYSESPGTGRFKYRVRARNADGASAYTNEVKT